MDLNKVQQMWKRAKSYAHLTRHYAQDHKINIIPCPYCDSYSHSDRLFKEHFESQHKYFSNGIVKHVRQKSTARTIDDSILMKIKDGNRDEDKNDKNCKPCSIIDAITCPLST